MTARPRNEISRNADLSARAADLYDQGLTDAAAAAALSVHAGRKISAKTARSFRIATYQPMAEERLRRREAAAKVRMVLDGAAGDYAQAGQELLAKMLYDLLSGDATLDPKMLKAAGQTFAKIREIDLAKARADLERAKYEAGREAVQIAGDTTLTAEERAARIRQVFGIS